AIAHLETEGQDVDLEPLEPLGGYFSHPADLGVHHFSRPHETCPQLGAIGDLPCRDADDVGVAGGDAEHAAPAATDEERGPVLAGFGQALVVDSIVLAVEVDRSLRPRFAQYD